MRKVHNALPPSSVELKHIFAEKPYVVYFDYILPFIRFRKEARKRFYGSYIIIIIMLYLHL